MRFFLVAPFSLLLLSCGYIIIGCFLNPYPVSSVYATIEGDNIGAYRVAGSLKGRHIDFDRGFIHYLDNDEHRYLTVGEFDSLRFLGSVPVDITGVIQKTSFGLPAFGSKAAIRRDSEAMLWLTRSGRDSLFLGIDTLLYRPYLAESILEIYIHVGSSRPDKRDLLFVDLKPEARYWDAIQDSVYFCIFRDSAEYRIF